MGNVKVIMCIVFLLQGFLFEVNAADINVNGQVVASPCIIDIATENQTVDFGKLQHRDFRRLAAQVSGYLYLSS